MFSFFNKDRNATEMIAVVDIGSSSVASALVELDRNGNPTIWQARRLTLPIEPTRDTQTLVRRILETTADALDSTSRAAQHRGVKEKARGRGAKPSAIAHVAVFLPSPWSTLFLRNVELKRAAPIAVNRDVIERMVGDYIKHERPDREEEAIVERSISGLRLNGYPVDDVPKNAQAQTIEMTIISATADKNLLTDIRNAIHKAVGHYTTVSFHATSVAASYSLTTIKPDISDYIFANSEGEVTELTLIAEHAPCASATAQIGCAVLPRTAAAHGIPAVEVPSALKLADNANSPMAHKMEPIEREAQKKCAAAFYTAVKGLLSKGQYAPSTVYLMHDTGDNKWVSDALSSDTNITSLFTHGLDMISISPQFFSPFVTMRMAGFLDPYLGLEALYADARFDRYKSFNFKI
ncbi:MAG TPA: hypothetical protein VF803_01560 [Candidatus Paceibacterota bacterium]